MLFLFLDGCTVDVLKTLKLSFYMRDFFPGVSCYSRHLDYKRFKEIAEENDAYLLADMAHVSGLVAAVLSPSPVADPGFSKWGGAVLSQMGGVHILFSGKKCMKLKEIGLKWGGAHLLAPCYSKITIFL